jgi:hypothetical protein
VCHTCRYLAKSLYRRMFFQALEHKGEMLSARGVPDDPELDGNLLAIPPLTSENDEESSGGETRTLNLAGPLEQDEYQHGLE